MLISLTTTKQKSAKKKSSKDMSPADAHGTNKLALSPGIRVDKSKASNEDSTKKQKLSIVIHDSADVEPGTKKNLDDMVDVLVKDSSK